MLMKCFLCGAEQETNKLEEPNKPRCLYCDFRGLVKIRPNIVRKVKAR